MGTKTLPLLFTDKAKPVKIHHTCELQQLFLISRHGTRYPTDNDITLFNELEKIFQNVSYAKKWYKNPFPLEKQGFLSKRGEKELYMMGKRSRKRYHKFWNKNLPYDPNVISFQSTSVARTSMSGFAYSLGLLNGEGILGKDESQSVYISSTPRTQDEELLMHNVCPRWLETIEKNNVVLENEKAEFNAKYLSKIANRISESYHITPELSPKQAEAIYKACAFAVAFYDETRTWCSLFNQNEILEIEYYGDLLDYYLFSYGNELNEKLGCRLVSNIISNIDKYLVGNSTLKADLKFAHAESLQFLTTILGLYEDAVPLTVNSLPEHMFKRKFRTSVLFYFSSNVYFEIYTCVEICGHTSAFIHTLVNEKSVTIPGCGSKYCEWNKFKELIGDKLNCNFKEICKV
ncbi:2305_t:CDS:2 [Funneliformis geosporum]|uniref:Multiple inositol polyphosphate phosphatase 1 n=1 Tax=Funneliformis geosporum TaxID=1117311 RepID=A0A9W4T0Z2_9GLOM|nr:14218_t:CDS:2 [Funneliformis geosporum]CAI2188991.1 2305_t:CDS:2 [Funneliformis geosporum]